MMSQDVKAEFSRAALCDSAVFLTVDAGYLCHALFTIDQLAKGHPERDFDFCIVTTDDLPPHDLIDRHNVRICRLATGSIAQDVPATARIPMAAYLRFYCARVLGADYARILYLDADLIYRRGNIAQLLRVDLGNHAIAGVREPVQFRRKNFIPKDMKGLGFGFFLSMNAGVQLIDTKAYNAARIGERAIELAVSRPEKMLAYDQTALNAVLQGKWAELPPCWNWLYGFRTLYYTELFDPAILHFTGRRKPWNHLNGEFPVKYANLYRAFYRAHFPEKLALMPPSAKPSQAKLRHLRYFIKHIIDLPRFVPQMDRFEDDFDIKL